MALVVSHQQPGLSERAYSSIQPSSKQAAIIARPHRLSGPALLTARLVSVPAAPLPFDNNTSKQSLRTDFRAVAPSKLPNQQSVLL